MEPAYGTSRLSVRAVRSHNPSRKATVGSVAPSHLAPCLTRWRREGWHRLRNPFNHIGIRRSVPVGDHLLQYCQGRFKLLVSHRLDAAGMLDLHLPRHQQDKQFQKYRRLVPHHLLYRLATALPEGGVHFPDGVGVKRMTRAMDVAGLCKNDRCLWPREGFSAANVLTPEQQPQALKSDSCVVAGRAVEDAEAGPKKTRA